MDTSYRAFTVAVNKTDEESYKPPRYLVFYTTAAFGISDTVLGRMRFIMATLT